MMEFDIRTDSEGDITISRPVGELDAFNASEFRSAMQPIGASPRLVIDLSGVSFVDSAGLGVLIGVVRRVHELGGVVMLASPRPALERLLRDTGVIRLAPVVATVEEAIEAICEQPPATP